jgi:glutathione S-transferase
MRKAHQGLAALEAEDLSGPQTIGTVTAACTLGYLDFRFPNDGWRRRHPKLAAWYRTVEASPAMQATKPPAS